MAEAAGDRARPGDFVRTAPPEHLPAGRVESVLAAPSGTRLLIGRAYAPGSYVVAPASEVVETHDDPNTGLRWHVLSVDRAALLRRGVYRRSLGRLVPDPLPHQRLEERDDAATVAELARVLDEDPLTRGAQIVARVLGGVAVLEGAIGTVGGKVAAERLARTTPGVWDCVNRLLSDEEVNGAVRDRLRLDPRLAAAVRDVHVTGGVVACALVAGAGAAAPAVEAACRSVPGVRDVTLTAT